VISDGIRGDCVRRKASLEKKEKERKKRDKATVSRIKGMREKKNCEESQ